MKIHKKFINLMNSCAKDDYQLSLAGIYFDLANMLAVATNGHHIITIPMTSEDLSDLALTESCIIKIKAKLNKSQKHLTLTKDNKNHWYNENNPSDYAILIDAEYPDYKAILNSFDTNRQESTISLSVLELKQIIKSIGNDDKLEVITIKLNPSDPMDRLIINVGKDANDIILMPCRQ